jgi:hypothetical protein
MGVHVLQTGHFICYIYRTDHLLTTGDKGVVATGTRVVLDSHRVDDGLAPGSDKT